MTGDSNHLFFEAIHSGIGILDETGEIQMFGRRQCFFFCDPDLSFTATRSRISVSCVLVNNARRIETHLYCSL